MWNPRGSVEKDTEDVLTDASVNPRRTFRREAAVPPRRVRSLPRYTGEKCERTGRAPFGGGDFSIDIR